jgi:hypothetical protein
VNGVYMAIANEIFAWGKVRPKQFARDDIEAVRDAAIAGQVPGRPTPWSSSYTKIAAASTHRADLDPTSQVLPQVIWDSRVSYAVTRLALPALVGKQEIFEFLKKQLLVVPGRGGNRLNNGPWTTELRQQGWSFATGSWRLRCNAFWRCQIVGSQLIHAMVGKLNSLPRFASERRGSHRWTSFDVALALFVEGY